jgi:hypothetical protein
MCILAKAKVSQPASGAVALSLSLRDPMLSLRFKGELFQLTLRDLHFVPLFQLLPTIPCCNNGTASPSQRDF